MYTVETCKQELIKCLEKILSRNEDIDKSKYDDLELELMEVRFGTTIIVFINDIKYTVNAFTSILSAEYIYNNIDKITYFYFEDYDFDSIVGDISKFIVDTYGYTKHGSEYVSAICNYSNYVNNATTTPSKNDILFYVERNVINEIKNKRNS